VGGGGMDDGAQGPRLAVSAGGRVSSPSPLLNRTLLTYPVFYLTLIHFYYPQNGFLLYKVEWGPAKNFSTPPFFDHKSATKRPPEHKRFLLPHTGNKTAVLFPS
jgi:hypothetical protein